MAIECGENTFGPIGEGRRRNNSPTRVPGDEESMQVGSSQETELASSLGESTGESTTSNVILPERGDIDGDEMVVVRRFIGILRRRLAALTAECHEVQFLSEEWWELINTIETIGNTIETLRRGFQRN